uniref:Uncharacterized protein n=1 Tax=Ditylenchus dipsaci TaxID=166011 RepID=A0A915D1L5_9BILA
MNLQNILKLFLTELGPKNLYSLCQDKNGQSPLHYAAASASLAACELLISNKKGELVVRLLASKKTIAVAMRNKRGMTAFHIAVLADNLPALRVLLNDLKFNPTVNVLDSDNRSCLMWAVIAGQEEVVRKLLIEKSIALFHKAHKDKKQLTALHLAALIGSKEICKLLVDHGYSSTERDAFEATPEHLAAGQGHIDALTYFAFNKGGPGPPLLDCMGRTPLFYACLGGQAHAVEVMSKGQSPSLDPINSLPCIKVLLQHHYNTNVADQDGKTPLDLAVSKSNQEIIKFLAERTS